MRAYNIGSEVYIHLTDGSINSFCAASEQAAECFVIQFVQDVHDIVTDFEGETDARPMYRH